MQEITSIPAGPVTEATWYQDAVIYELHVRAFADASGDGTGDFRGLTAKLDYLQDLGVTAIWLLPFYPSPLRDDGYDIADYRDIHPNYGTMADFREFLREAHDRDIRVITELVLNHTSDQHPWFQRARRAAPDSPDRDFYVWSQTHNRYAEARIIFQDFEKSNWTWDSVADAYFWHRFYSHQPDLNFENPRVREEMFRVLDYWMQMGVDGIRLDAVPYLYEREGTNCENLPETHAFLKRLRAHIDARYHGRMLLAEANQWPEDAVRYFGDSDECHMAFHFPIMPRLFMAVEMEDRFPVIDILRQTPAIPETSQWALFLRNHDELTLEMVTDEERDYMYRSYARDTRARVNLGIRRRLAPLLGNNRRKIELMVALLFSLPGTPVLYYGDEIGMGDNIYLGDRNAVRTPMQWSADRNAGFSRANAQSLYLPITIDPEYHYEAVNVETQLANPSSLLWWHRRIIALRKRHRAFGRGDLQVLECENFRVLAFVRSYGGESILCVANLSRYAQHVELDLAPWLGRVPVELFSQNDFPRIQHGHYGLTLGPHSFLWFALQERADTATVTTAETAETPPVVEYSGRVTDLLRGTPQDELARHLAKYCASLDWLKLMRIETRNLRMTDALRLNKTRPALFLVRLTAPGGALRQNALMLPVKVVPLPPDEAARRGQGDVFRLRNERTGEMFTVCDASQDPAFAQALHNILSAARTIKGEHGRLVLRKVPGTRNGAPQEQHTEDFQIARTEQGNLVSMHMRTLVAKLVTRPQPGPHPDVEICGAMGDSRRKALLLPSMISWAEYQSDDDNHVETVAILQKYIPNQGTADRWLGDHMARVMENAATATAPVVRTDACAGACPNPAAMPVWSPSLGDLFLPLREPVTLLGRRLAELHLLLATRSKLEAFAPEPFTTLYQRGLYQSMRNRTGSALKLLRGMREAADAELGADLQRLVQARFKLDEFFRDALTPKVRGARIRIHGDMHLGQVLFTGNDFSFLDFEGDASVPLSERRIRRSPLRDLASLLWSLRLVACRETYVQETMGYRHRGQAGLLDPVARAWAVTLSLPVMEGYLSVEGVGDLLPEHPEEITRLTGAYMLDRALYDVERSVLRGGHETRIVLHALLELVDCMG